MAKQSFPELRKFINTPWSSVPTQSAVNESASPMANKLEQEYNALQAAQKIGDSRSAEINSEDTTGTKGARNYYMSPEEAGSYMNTLEGLAPIKNQRAALADRRGYQADLLKNTPDQKDLSPILNLIDSWTGSKLTQGYKKPQSSEQRFATAIGMNNQDVKDQGDINEQVMKNMQLLKAGSDQTSMLKKLGDTLKQGQLIPKQEKSGGSTVKPEVLLAQHQKRMEPMEELRLAYEDLNNLVGGADNWKGEDIAGAGRTGKFPELLLSSEGKNIQGSVTKLASVLGKLRSGGQITSSELIRLEREVGSGLMSTDEGLIKALQRMGPALKAQMEQKEAAIKGMHPEILKLYHEGGGTVSSGFNPPTGHRSHAPPFTPSKKAKDMSDAELDAILSGG